MNKISPQAFYDKVLRLCAACRQAALTRTILTTTLLWCVAANVATAADVHIVNYRFSQSKTVPLLRLEGIILRGDVEKYKTALERVLGCSAAECGPDGTGVRAVVSLDSPGGSLLEGIALAEAFREDAVATVIEADQSCLSACALAFLGGTGVWSTGGIGYFRDRTIEPGAKLGFHSPFFPSSKVSQILEEKQVTNLLDLTRMSISKFAGHLNRFGINPLVFDAIIEMGQDEYFMIDRAERLYYTNTTLPQFPPHLLGVSSNDAIRNVCARLIAEFYKIPLGQGQNYLADACMEDVSRDQADRVISGFPVDESPYVLSACGVPKDHRSEIASTVFLYRSGSDAAYLESFLKYQNATEQGWSSVSPGKNIGPVMNTLNHFMIPANAGLMDLPASISDHLASQRYASGSGSMPQRSSGNGANLLFDATDARSWVYGDVIITERVGTAQLYSDLKEEADGSFIDLALSRDFDNSFVRSGHYGMNGNAFYWAAFVQGNQSYVLRVEYNQPGKDIRPDENKITKAFACSTDFSGVRLPCFH
ncbi:hypothetical protein [Parasedimentitalea huanghaiensis]|uniref:Uncharacterized protein n=1 Tax=Parasedimentitalea huanghaiensis TaxID=2682100 RepID=A0A6L6WQF6_9RHOB|nr:hypothetical protein [Zongyanglinia huanghaiensis]MVO17782.1 hypothetical protein [Zongyanglinia huanghaiensis]